MADEPPNQPIISGPSSGKPGRTYTYNFLSIDPDDDMIYYFIDWGDGSNSSWIGPYQSNEEISLSHKWSKKGIYDIQVKAKDVFDVESEWSIFQVIMPRDKSISSSPLLRFLERYPLLNLLLQRLNVL